MNKRTLGLAMGFFYLLTSGSTAMAATPENILATLSTDLVMKESMAKDLKRATTRPFLEKMARLGFAEGVYQVAAEEGFLPGLLFSKMKSFPDKIDGSCQAVFCEDSELRDRLDDEIRRGRLVLLTSSTSGFNAAVITETPETAALKKSLGGDAKKNVLIVTPKTLVTTLAHELTHAEDDESGVLKSLLERTKQAFKDGEISAANGRTIHQFAGEVRAYENEMRYLLKHSRTKEFLADDEGDAGTVKVRTADKKEFLMRRLVEIDWKVRDFYLPAFIKAMEERSWKSTSRSEILNHVKKLLPEKGPYSYVSLVEPRL